MVRQSEIPSQSKKTTIRRSQAASPAVQAEGGWPPNYPYTAIGTLSEKAEIMSIKVMSMEEIQVKMMPLLSDHFHTYKRFLGQSIEKDHSG